MHALDPKFMARLRPILIHEQKRIGSKNDGGYVLAETVLKESNFLLAFGYGNNSDFEEEFIRLQKVNSVNLYDSSINLNTLLRSLLLSFFFKLTRKRSFPIYQIKCLLKYLKLKSMTRVKYFNLKIIGHKSNYLKSERSISEILDSLSAPNSTILKMDIEGSEYECLLSVIDHANLHQINSLIIEFHSVPRNVSKFMQIIEGLSISFQISNLHINNYVVSKSSIPEVIEIAFIHKKLLSGNESYVFSIPNPLDKPCDPKRDEITFFYS